MLRTCGTKRGIGWQRLAVWLACLVVLMGIHNRIGRSACALEPDYEIVPLQTVVGDGLTYQAFARDISSPVSNDRIVAGYAQIRIEGEDVKRPICWLVDSLGSSQHLVLSYPTDLFSGGVATGVNDLGAIVGGGLVQQAAGNGVGLYWANPSAAPQIIPSMAGQINTMISQINNDGIIVGFTQFAASQRAVAWRVRSDGTIAGPLALPTRRRGSINDAALSVGPTKAGITEIAGASDNVPVLWKVRSTAEGGLMLEGSIEVLDSVGKATGCSVSGAVCGVDRSRAVVWGALAKGKRSKTLLNFNQTVFGTPGEPYDMNLDDTIVGMAYLNVNFPAPRAVIWSSRSASMQMLEAVASESAFQSLESASAINDAGEIAGYGWMGAASGYQAFVAVPLR